jgi:hypothetical protein
VRGKGDDVAKFQRVYKVGADYYVEGVAERGRWLRCVGRGKFMGREILMFRPVRKARKRHKSQ